MTKRGGIPEDFIEQVKSANNIVAVAGRYFPLKQKGKNHWGNCPFHHEKTASFAVNEQQQFYKCFGCGTSGNVITLVKQLESTDFLGAVEFLAKWANMTMPTVKLDPEYLGKRKKKERILECLEFARDYYCKNLYKEKNGSVLEYLHGRGITDELIKTFNIGASDDWDTLVKQLRKAGYTDDEIIDSGVGARSDKGSLYDAMKDRITFAIFDLYGSCIGFTGRTMSDDKNVAKYRNTAQTMVYDKSAVVYGVDVLKKNKLSNFVDKLVVVEGNVDVISLVGAGFINTVACMGTALTQFHARVFKRFSPNIYLCFDGDKAGKAAALKSLDILESEGLTVRVVALPDDIDPDTFITKNGKDSFQKLMDNAVPMVDYKLDILEKTSNLSDNLGRQEYFKKAVAILKALGVESELYIPKISKISGISHDGIKKSISPSVGAALPPAEPKHDFVANNKFSNAQTFITAAVAHGKVSADFEKLSGLDIKNHLCKKILNIIEGRKRDGGEWQMQMLFDEMEDDVTELKPVIEYEFQMSQSELERYYLDCLKTLTQANEAKTRDELQAKFNATTDTEERAKLLGEISKLNRRAKVC